MRCSLASNRYELVIFDCDGVLVDSEKTSNLVLAEILNAHGSNLTIEDALQMFIGKAVDDIRATALSDLGIDLPDDWSTAYYAALIPVLAKRVQPIEGALEAVRALHVAGQAICVASQGPPEKMRTTLGATGLADFFRDRIFSAKSVKNPKPSPDLFLYAAEQCGVAPETCAVVEDSPIGVAAAVAAGMSVFALCPLDRTKNMLTQGAIPFHSMTDLPRVLLNSR